MNIKEFLLDNYIWILVVILLAIITIIGFLADKKRASKKAGDANNQNQVPQPAGQVPNQQQAFNYQPQSGQVNEMVSGMPMANNQANQTLNQVINNPLNNVNNGVNTAIQGNTTGVGEMVANNVTPDNGVNNVNQGSIPVAGQPLVNNGIANGGVVPGVSSSTSTNPVPVENLSQNQSTPSETIYQPLSEQKPSFAPNPNVNATLSQVLPNQSTETLGNSMPVGTNNQVVGGVTASQPTVNQVVTNNLPGYNPNLNNTVNNGSLNGENMQQGNTVPNPVEQPNPAPINFVYGPQSNNNQNM